jgi:hypothetical protein
MVIDLNGSLTIYSLKTKDRGSYVCEVSNDIGQAKQQFQVDIYGEITLEVFFLFPFFILLEPPSLMNNSLEIELDVNIFQPILLPCPVTGHPPATIVWSRQNNPINRTTYLFIRKENIIFQIISIYRSSRYEYSFTYKWVFRNQKS